MAVEVSVVVPVYNTGEFIEPCIASLLGQSMPDDHYELLFVDDGSTDGTPQRLDRLAAEAPNVRVFHEPNSGWPGRPRNVGIDAAVGDYVFFCDHDDWLGEEALARMVAYARRNDADLLIPKMVGHGRGVPRELFRRNVAHASLGTTPLMTSLTPHKLFRRAFLDEHRLRFPEGRRRLEDHVFVVEAYFLARSIAVLADYPCYHHIAREDDANAAHQQIDPVGYYNNVREVIDIIERHTEPGPLRDALLERPFGHEMQARFSRRRFTEWDDDFRQGMLDEVRRLSHERFPDDFGDRLSATPRSRAAAIRRGDLAAIDEITEHSLQWGTQPWLADLVWRDDAWHATLESELVHNEDGRPFRLVADDAGRGWWVDDALIPRRLQTRPDTTEQLEQGYASVIVVERETDIEWYAEDVLLPEVRTHPVEPGVARLVFTGTVRLDPAALALGRPLEPGLWNLQVRAPMLGRQGQARLGPADPKNFPLPRPMITGPAPRVVSAFLTRPHGKLTLDVGEQRGSLVSELLGRPIGAVQRRGRRLVATVDVDVAARATAYRLPLVVVDGERTIARLDASVVAGEDGGVLRVGTSPHQRRLHQGLYSVGVEADEAVRLLGTVRVGPFGSLAAGDFAPKQRARALPAPPPPPPLPRRAGHAVSWRVRRLRRRVGGGHRVRS